MRAGLLDRIVTVYRYVEQVSDSGMRSKVRLKLYDMRCRLLRSNGSYKNIDNQEYDRQTLVFETWKRTDIKDTDVICYCCQDFKIVLVDYAYNDNTMRLTCQKILN